MPSKLVRIDSLKEGDEIRLRGGKKEYSVVMFSRRSEYLRGTLFLKDKDNKEYHRMYFPFTLVHKTITP